MTTEPDNQYPQLPPDGIISITELKTYALPQELVEVGRSVTLQPGVYHFTHKPDGSLQILKVGDASEISPTTRSEP